MSWWTVLKYTVLGLFCGAEWVKEHYRSHSIHLLARKHGLTFLGKLSLPGALCLYGTPFAHVNAPDTSNLIDGTLGGIHVVVFDCVVWEGQSNWQRTVLCLRTADEAVAKSLNSALTVDRAAQWLIAYRAQGSKNILNDDLTAVSELEASLESIAAQSHALAAQG